MARQPKEPERKPVEPWRCSFRSTYGRCGLPAGIYPPNLGPRDGSGRCAYHFGIDVRVSHLRESVDEFLVWTAKNEPKSIWTHYPQQVLFEVIEGRHYFEPIDGNPNLYGWQLVRGDGANDGRE